MQRRDFVRIAAGAAAAPMMAAERLPNVVLIYADDIGYGDLGCYGARRLKTPNLDRLAREGVRFTDAHCTSATCTPSRYALITGEYPWRRPGTSVLPGNANLIIDPQRPTLPRMLQQAGYRTAAVGKWHLGLGRGEVNWNGLIRPGANEVGFDETFLVPATGDRTPCVYVENGRVAGLDPKDPITVGYQSKVGNEPTGRENPELLKVKPSHGHDQTIVNGVSRIGYMTGGKAARWVDEDMADVLTRKGVSFIERSAGKPFFLYFATHDIHVPRLPHQRFTGKSGCGIRCDAAEELDWCAGELLKTLEKTGAARNTLVIFSSDNGPVVDDGYQDRAVEDLNGHVPAGPWRGGKYSLYEAGTRVPFLARWPGRIRPGVSDALVSQIDLYSSLAAIAGQKLGDDAGPDSFDMSAALLGEDRKGRDWLVEHGQTGIALRKGQWKYMPPAPNLKAATGPIAFNRGTRASAAPEELYDLASDPAETRNVAAEKPEVVREMAAALEKIRRSPKSRS
jgi:arylsulfatase A-like enzyme